MPLRLPRHDKPPLGLRWRSSTWFIALTCGLGILVDLASYSLIVPVIPFRLETLGYSNVGGLTGWLVAAYAAGLIASSPPIAYLGEKVHGRQMPLLIALMFMVAATILFMFANSFALMVVARILQGISGTGIWTLGLALVRDSTPEARFGIVMGYVLIGFSCGSLIGPLLGGILYEKLGWRAPFIFAIILVAIDLVLRLLIIEQDRAITWIERGVEIPNFESPNWVDGKRIVRQENEHKKSAWKGLVHLVTAPRPVIVLLLTFLNGFSLGGMLETQMTLWLAKRYGYNSLQAGLVYIAGVVPTFVVSPLAGWIVDRHGAKWVSAGGVALTVPCYLLLIISGPIPLFIFFLVLLGASLALFITPATHDLGEVVKHNPFLGAAHVYGAFNLAFSVGALVGPIIAGQLVDALEIRKGWISMASICAGLALLMVVPTAVYVGGPLSSSRFWRTRTKADSSASEQEKQSKEADVADRHDAADADAERRALEARPVDEQGMNDTRTNV